MQISIGKIRRSQTARQLGIASISLVAVILLYQRVGSIDIPAVLAVFQSFPLSIWLIAAVFTCISLAAAGVYDVLAAQYLKLEISAGPAFAAGWRATAIAQTLGFGLFTGALTRWKLLSPRAEFSLWQATQMTGTVTACFFGGWAVVTSGAILVSPDIAPRVWWLGLLGGWCLICVSGLSFHARSDAKFAFPAVRLIGKATVLTLVDTMAACAVIYYFLPIGYAPFLTLFSAFLIAYFMGMISGIPGGLGPFELCLITLLPSANPTPLFAAMLAYRAVYFAGPALMAVASLKISNFKEPYKATAPLPEPDITPPPAEISLLKQGQLMQIGAPEGLTRSLGCQTVNSEFLFRDPYGGNTADFLKTRRQDAQRSFRGLLAYKISAPTAKAVRSLGMTVHQIGSEALLRPAKFTLNTPKRAQLRRKLRSCQKGGVHVEPAAPNFSRIVAIDKEWQDRNGPARGFSMGRVAPSLIAQQVVFTAYRDDDAIAFITFHRSRDRWVLDLMRSRDGCPDGTNHALIHAAINTAKAQGVEELSLCSVPLYIPDHPKSWLENLIKRAYRRNADSAGLYRFKSSFAPDWEPQFVAADGFFTLFSSGLELYALIHRRGETAAAAQPPQDAHDHYDNYQFDSSALTCEEAR